MLHIILRFLVRDNLQPNPFKNNWRHVIRTLTQMMKSLTGPNVRQILVFILFYLGKAQNSGGVDKGNPVVI